MIQDVLICIKEEIDTYFQSKLRINEEKIIISGLVNQDGTIAIQGENKIIITLINIEKEPTTKSSAAGSSRVLSNTSPPLSINLYLLFSAYFTGSNYVDSLQLLSYVIAFLQDKSVFTRSNTPRLDDGIEKLTIEMESIGSEKLNNIWSTLGAKYMPSVVYKVRMITYDSLNIKEYRPLISGIASAARTPDVPPCF